MIEILRLSLNCVDVPVGGVDGCVQGVSGGLCWSRIVGGGTSRNECALTTDARWGIVLFCFS